MCVCGACVRFGREYFTEISLKTMAKAPSDIYNFPGDTS